MRKRTNPNASMHLEPLEGRQMMAAGDLDLSFGIAGKVLAADTVGYPVADVAVQPDGKVVVVGTLNGNFAVTRFNANGTLDRSFGGGGFLRTDFGESDEANAVAIQPDGKIIVAGRRGIPIHFGNTPEFALARYNRNGTPDRTFDGDGKLIVDFGSASGANALALQPDGKILVAGFADEGGTFGDADDEFAIARLLPNGKLDDTFGDRRTGLLSNGKRTGRTTTEFKSAPQTAQATMIAAAPDGKILVGGPLHDAHFGVLRLHANGTADTSYFVNGDGAFLQFTQPGTRFHDMHVSADGSVTLAGGRNGNFLTARVTKRGDFDRSFGGGVVETDFGGNDEARHVFVNREGILVAGESDGKFAMLRLRMDGKRDLSFSRDGKVITAAGADDAILTTTLSPDGKLTAYGRSGSAARYIAAEPTVNVFSLDPSGAEGGNNPASLIFTRDLRLSFPTRVFYSLGGTATLEADYKGPKVLQPAATGGALAGGLTFTPVGGIPGAPVGFVDIPANQTTVTVPINVLDDRSLEPVETVLASIRANPAYKLGDRTKQTVTLADNDIVRVNFQEKPSPNAFAFETDLGLTFGARANGLRFGWDADNRANARTRPSTGRGLIYDTFNHMQKPGGGSKWEIALPNGMYEVKLAAGDPNQVDSVHSMNLENAPAVGGTPAGNVRWFERTVNVLVNDGRLTLTNGAGAANNKVAFIEIRSAAPGAAAGPVTGIVPVTLPRVLPTLRPGGTILP